MGQSASSPNRGALRPSVTPSNTPAPPLPPASQLDSRGVPPPRLPIGPGGYSGASAHDRDLQEALERSALEAAIQESLRQQKPQPAPACPPPPTAAVAVSQPPSASTQRKRPPQTTNDYFSPFQTSTVDCSQEETDRAIAVALADAENGRPAGKIQEATDQDLARKLQEQFDREAALQMPGGGQAPAAAGASEAGFHPPLSPSSCSGCGQPFGWASMLGGGRIVTAAGCSWHPECFKCHGCLCPINSTFKMQAGVPYHSDCHRQRFHPRCTVCEDYIPPRADGFVEYSENAYWKTRFCSQHITDGTPRCYSCDRLQKKSEEFVRLQDDRHACLTCLDSIVVDTRDCQPLYEDVLAFYASQGMPLPVRPPFMLVEASALNDAEDRERRQRRQGPVFHTRGLCLTEIYTQVHPVYRAAGGSSWQVRSQEMTMPKSHARITAILVMFGLPRLLTGSILAHEVMHAWIKLTGGERMLRLEPHVEEGLCQLMAHLWLEAQQPYMLGMQGHEAQDLRDYFLHQIRMDPSPVYGDGFRAALQA
eukprot:CAMPEP_0117666978 /NCGR_PEP_ID=MMETSP0804-20121206/10688_1 /TAXON_ID=1074897 /ORGANISM="Tetraselmis astigmatica, Strain CCMP880" /LENGTH=535 /DNA_ID=CAMNT_0005474607 /DNA_START=220 /DNA_END=1824 /DNA_ORIENTATION=-